MATISGIWKFDKTKQLTTPNWTKQTVWWISCNHPTVSGDSIQASNNLRFHNGTEVQFVAYNFSTSKWETNYFSYYEFIGLAEQEVSDDFYAWWTTNAIKQESNTEITYNGITTSVEEGKTATLACNGKRMKTDIVVDVRTSSWVEYNGKNTAVEKGKTATLACAGKKMLSNVCVSSITHALYNGVRLPVIPEIVLMGYPYAWIRKNTTSGYYDLLLSEIPFYYSDGVRDGSEKTGKPWHRLEITTAETATEWTNNTAANTFGSWGVDTARTVLWSNHDIPNGSANATDIYFYGSDPVPTE